MDEKIHEWLEVWFDGSGYFVSDWTHWVDLLPRWSRDQFHVVCIEQHIYHVKGLEYEWQSADFAREYHVAKAQKRVLRFRLD